MCIRDSFVTAEKVKNAFLGLEHRYHTLMQVFRPVSYTHLSDMLDAVLVPPFDLCGGKRRQVFACRHDVLLEFCSRFHN